MALLWGVDSSQTSVRDQNKDAFSAPVIKFIPGKPPHALSLMVMLMLNAYIRIVYSAVKSIA